MLTFTFKTERDAFVESIKEEGLYLFLSKYMDNETEGVFNEVWKRLCCRMSEEDFEAFVDEVLESIGYEEDNEDEILLR